MVEVIDICVLTGAGLVGGICIGLIVNNKKIKSLKEEVESGDRSYMNLAESYMELFSSHRNLKFATQAKAKTEIAKKSPGRPKGSTNKTKKDGGSTTRKYTRKSSK
jgi:hypothetical protein